QIAAIYQKHEGTYPGAFRENWRSWSAPGPQSDRSSRARRRLRGQPNARFKAVTTESNHDLPIAPNRLREAVATRPNQIGSETLNGEQNDAPPGTDLQPESLPLRAPKLVK